MILSRNDERDGERGRGREREARTRATHTHWHVGEGCQVERRCGKVGGRSDESAPVSGSPGVYTAGQGHDRCYHMRGRPHTEAQDIRHKRTMSWSRSCWHSARSHKMRRYTHCSSCLLLQAPLFCDISTEQISSPERWNPPLLVEKGTVDRGPCGPCRLVPARTVALQLQP